ncbi:MAG: hypothetical protein QOI78_812 [Actinomycetota bacterium]|jgi:hypothetical protein|nr:hypothetical protein [Actinomycetota bacterium]
MDLLPGGYFDTAGALHREFELATLTGREEELLAGTRPSQTATLVTEVLSRCVTRLGDISPVPPEVLRRLLVADRQYLLLRLRAATFGDQVRASLVCPWPECGKQLSLDFSLDAVPVEGPPHSAPSHTMTVPGSGTEVVFRLPNGADQEELAERLAVNEAEALTLLLSRCIERIGPDSSPTVAQVAALPSAVRAAIEERMRQLTPKIEQRLEAECSECGRGFVAPFDIHRFFFGDLRTDAGLLYREVHYLAYHYHWSEQEIMAMTRDKRRTYIDVLADAIEVLNGGA